MTTRIAVPAILALLLVGCPPPSMPAAPAERAAQQTNTAPIQSGVSLVLVLDTSGSMAGEKIETMKRVWSQTLSTKLHAYQNLTGRLELCIVQCGNSSGVICQITSNVAAADSVVAGLSADGGTPLGGAMGTAYQQAVDCRRERKHIFVLSDGAANSGDSPRPVLDAMQSRQEGISVYVIGFQTDRGNYADFEQTGGRVVMADDAATLERVCADIFADILKPEAE